MPSSNDKKGIHTLSSGSLDSSGTVWWCVLPFLPEQLDYTVMDRIANCQNLFIYLFAFKFSILANSIPNSVPRSNRGFGGNVTKGDSG